MESRTCFEPMRAREPLRVMPTRAFPAPTPKPREANKTGVRTISKRKTRGRTCWQFVPCPTCKIYIKKRRDVDHATAFHSSSAGSRRLAGGTSHLESDGSERGYQDIQTSAF